MIKLYVVRHDKTDWNDLNIMQGLTDIPLNEEGRRQAKALAQQIDLANIDLCLSSPLKRARETADIIVGEKIEVIEEQLCVERSLGEYEGKTIDFDLVYRQWNDFDDKTGNAKIYEYELN